MYKKKRDNKPGQSKGIECWGKLMIGLACVALLAIIIYVVVPMICPDRYENMKEATTNGMMLTCVTLSITLAVVVPWMISRTKIYDVAEDAVKKYYEKDFKREIRRNQEALLRDSANDARMIAYLLCNIDKPVWALGWACKSATTYGKLAEDHLDSNYKKLKTSTIHVLIDCILKINVEESDPTSILKVMRNDNNERGYAVAIRTTRDLLKYNMMYKLKSRDYKEEFKGIEDKGIPETLSKAMNDTFNLLAKVLLIENGGKSLYRILRPIDEDSENEEYYKLECDLYESKLKDCDVKDIKKEFIDSKNSLSEAYNAYKEKVKIESKEQTEGKDGIKEDKQEIPESPEEMNEPQ